MKISVGYQLPDLYRISDIIMDFIDDIEEVYFPWLHISSGRGVNIASPKDQEEMEKELTFLHQQGIKLNMLWNANCYGSGAVSQELEKRLTKALKHAIDQTGLEIVTTTSLFIAERVRKHFPDLEIRASVNMDISTVEGMRYVRDYFDGFYLGRKLNRYPAKIKPIRQWCDENGKKLYLLANSGCLKDCSAHTFHDNLVAHESELYKHENIWPGFRGICWEYYAENENHLSFLRDSTWIRPEDIDRYSDLVDGVKLATRIHDNPELVIKSFVNRKFDGNILKLCEPNFCALCFLDNARFPSDWAERVAQITEIERENYFKQVFKAILH